MITLRDKPFLVLNINAFSVKMIINYLKINIDALENLFVVIQMMK